MTLIRLILSVVIITTLNGCGKSAEPIRLPSNIVCDFGLLENRQVFRKEIEFRNTLEVPLRIETSRVSCGCLNLGSLPHEIPAGDLAVFNLTLSPAVREGLIHHSAVIFTNNTETPEIRIDAYGVANGAWVGQPKEVNFGFLAEPKSTQKSITVYAAGDEDTVFSPPRSSSHRVNAQLAGTVRRFHHAGTEVQAQTVDLQLNDALVETGQFSADVTISCFRRGEPIELRFPVSATIESSIQLNPRALIYGPVSPGAMRETVVKVEGFDLTAMDLSKIRLEDDHECVESRVVTSSHSAPSIICVATIPLDFSGQMIRGEIVGTYDERVVIRLPYVILVDLKR